jgi:hypothetical protein
MSDPVSATEEGAKAIAEVAKATGKVVDAGRAMGGFIAKYVHGTVEQGMGIFHDKIIYARWERQIRLIDRASAFLAERGLQEPPNGVAMKFAVPLLQAATLEDDDGMQDIWARLLVNASIDPKIAQARAYISMLEDMAPLDARILAELHRAEGAPYTSLNTCDLPATAWPLLDAGDVQPLREPTDEVAFSLGNLARIGAITPGGLWNGGVTVAQVKLTMLGRELVNACSSHPQP